MSEMDSALRFSDRVEAYVRYRPDYPPALLNWLQREHGVTTEWRVADIGAGTGISAKLFLDAGHDVTAVEPNGPMRAAAVKWLAGYPKFKAIDGRAEATTLAADSIELVSAAQAFHWFDREKVKSEWRRILKPSGLVAVYWNSRRLTGTAFLEHYEALLREFGTDYANVAEQYSDDVSMRKWFGAGFRGSAKFVHGQRLDFDGLRGRLLSSSYAPREGHPRHEPMLSALRDVFKACSIDGRVSFDYDTRIFVGRPA